MGVPFFIAHAKHFAWLMVVRLMVLFCIVILSAAKDLLLRCAPVISSYFE